MASVVRPLLVPAMPEILHLQAPKLLGRFASSRKDLEVDAETHTALHRSKTVTGIGGIEFDAEYPSGLVSRDCEVVRPPRRSKTVPVSGAVPAQLGYLTGLAAGQTAPELPPESPVFLQLHHALPDDPGPTVTVTAPRVARPVLALDTMLASSGSYCGNSNLPTVGSAWHHLGLCKPCAFAWKDEGCGNGLNCPFCHLCGPGEKKRRQKEKKACMKAAFKTATKRRM